MLAAGRRSRSSFLKQVPDPVRQRSSNPSHFPGFALEPVLRGRRHPRQHGERLHRLGDWCRIRSAHEHLLRLVAELPEIDERRGTTKREEVQARGSGRGRHGIRAAERVAYLDALEWRTGHRVEDADDARGSPSRGVGRLCRERRRPGHHADA
jgi:hypothetical protein